jgi:hypothetical protein
MTGMKCSLDYFQRALGQLKIFQRGSRDPCDAPGVVPGEKLPSQHCTQVIVEDVMILGAALGVGHDALEDFEEAFWANDESGFLQHFASKRVLNFLPGFNQSAGKGPIAFERIASALNQEDGIPANDDRADAGERVWRVAPGHVPGIYRDWGWRRERVRRDGFN